LRDSFPEEAEQGAIIVVLATDAPVTPDQLKRIVKRVSLGMGRMGSIHGNGSGDIFIASSTANAGADSGNSRAPDRAAVSSIQRLISGRIDALFTATVQTTEEAITNAMIAAETMTGADYWRSYARTPTRKAISAAPPCLRAGRDRRLIRNLRSH